MEKPCINLGAVDNATREPASRLFACQRLAGLPHELAGDEINTYEVCNEKKADTTCLYFICTKPICL